MKVLWIIHAYVPLHNCGAEWMAHELNKALIESGHDVTVMIMGSYVKDYQFEGVNVVMNKNDYGSWIAWADVVVTHLGWTGWTIRTVLHKPIVWVMHNTSLYGSVKSNSHRVHVVYNSEAAKGIVHYPNPSIVIPPPVRVKKIRKKGDKITLINLNENKGGNVLKVLASKMPEHKFLGVVGSYGEQILDQPNNVEIYPNTPNIEQVFEQTKIIIMPSEYESWGRVATEAMMNGIPVICTPTFGLKENCGDAAYYVEREDVKGWHNAIMR